MTQQNNDVQAALDTVSNDVIAMVQNVLRTSDSSPLSFSRRTIEVLLECALAQQQPVNAELLDALKLEADSAYCRYIDIIDSKCRGMEYAIQSGKFTMEMLESYRDANERLGFHRGIYRALKSISEQKGGVNHNLLQMITII